MKVKILIVEDEAIVALEIKTILAGLGYIVTDTVANYDEALKSVLTNKPDIILMDIYLKNSKDGIETAIAIKQIAEIPIVYLSAFCDDATVSRAVATEPMAYLVKPFKREDIKTTINMVIFKLDKSSNIDISKELLDLGNDYYYDEKLQLLYYQNQLIKLTNYEKKFMDYMIQSKGITVPFKALEDYIWNGNIVSDSSLRTLVYRLRMKFNFKVIENIHSVGFRLKLN